MVELEDAQAGQGADRTRQLLTCRSIFSACIDPRTEVESIVQVSIPSNDQGAERNGAGQGAGEGVNVDWIQVNCGLAPVLTSRPVTLAGRFSHVLYLLVHCDHQPGDHGGPVGRAHGKGDQREGLDVR